MQLVQCGAAAERERRQQVGLGRDLHQSVADDQILFHLEILHPRHVGAPRGNVVARDHASGSTSAFM
jgi:hypothetical protein